MIFVSGYRRREEHVEGAVGAMHLPEDGWTAHPNAFSARSERGLQTLPVSFPETDRVMEVIDVGWSK
jgi:hypothetical protein